MKIQYKKLGLCIAIPLMVGAVSALLTRNSMQMFAMLEQPSLSPPGWLFPVVWTILYVLMGIASYLVLVSDTSKTVIESALFVYGTQLFLNFWWSIIFFRWERYFFAFIWLLLLEGLILLIIRLFYRITKPAGMLMIPYAVWVAFAGYLNLGIYLLNR